MSPKSMFASCFLPEGARTTGVIMGIESSLEHVVRRGLVHAGCHCVPTVGGIGFTDCRSELSRYPCRIDGLRQPTVTTGFVHSSKGYWTCGFVVIFRLRACREMQRRRIPALRHHCQVTGLQSLQRLPGLQPSKLFDPSGFPSRYAWTRVWCWLS